MTDIFRVVLVALLSLGLGVMGVAAGDGPMWFSPIIMLGGEEYQKIYADPALTTPEKAAAIVECARKSHDDEVMAMALVGAIYMLGGKERKANEEAWLAYHKELMALPSDKPIVVQFQKAMANLPEDIAADEKRWQDTITGILESDDGIEQAETVLHWWRDLAEDQQLARCVEAIKDPSLRGKVAFAIYDDAVGRALLEKGAAERLKRIIASAGELGAKYVASQDAGNREAFAAIRQEIWQVDDARGVTAFLAQLRFIDGLHEKQGVRPPLLSAADKAAYAAHVAQIEAAYRIVHKAIKHIAHSKNVFYRKGKECSGAMLAFRMRAKLHLCKKIDYDDPLGSFFLSASPTLHNVVGVLSPSHAPKDGYKVKSDEGTIMDVCVWALRTMELTDEDKKLLEANGYAWVWEGNAAR